MGDLPDTSIENLLSIISGSAELVDVNDFLGDLWQDVLKKDENDDNYAQQPVILRGKTGRVNPDDYSQLAELVVEALHGWDNADGIERTRDVSGHPAAKTFKVTGPNCFPSVVSLHMRDAGAAGNELEEERTKIASNLFAAHGFAPRRVAEGGDWFIEAPYGEPLDALDKTDCLASPDALDLPEDSASLEELGQFLARIHTEVPTPWYNQIRTNLREEKPALSESKAGSHIWWWAAQAKFLDWVADVPGDALKWFAEEEAMFPVSSAGRRIVVIHGDFTPRNIIRGSSGELCLIDFRHACVGSAAQEIGWSATFWMRTPAKKRLFITSYLAAAGEPSNPADVENLLLDCEISSLAMPRSPMWPLKDEKVVGDIGRCKQLVDLVKQVRSSELEQKQVLEMGLFPYIKSKTGLSPVL